MACPSVAPSATLLFDPERHWVSALEQLNQNTWAALADGHLKLLDLPSWSLSPAAVRLDQHSFVRRWGPHEIALASGSTLSLRDVRQPQPAFVTSPTSGSGKPYSSIAVRPESHAVALGTELHQHEACVELWDMRNQKASHVYREIHSDDVATLSFHPVANQQHILLSGSTDGLFSVTDLTLTDEDDAVLGVGQVGASVKSALWASEETGCPVWALTDMQTLSLFTSQEPELLQDYGDLRTQKKFTVPSDFNCDYAIDFDGRSSIMLGSNSSAFLQVDLSDPEGFQSKRCFRGGHQNDEVIRCAVSSFDGSLVLSGGEDGQIVAWPLQQENSSLGTKLHQSDSQSGKKSNAKKHRYAPY